MQPPDRNISYSVSCNGHHMGDFEIDRIVELLACGEFKETDLYFTEGMADWDVLSSLRKEVEAAKAFPPSKVNPAPPVAKRPKIKTPPLRKRQTPKQAARSQSQSGSASVSPVLFLAVVIGLLCGYLWTVCFPRERVVTVDRVRAVPVERVVATDAGSAITADDLRRLGLGAAVEAALVTDREDHKLFPLTEGSLVQVSVKVVGSVANGGGSEEKVRARVAQLLTARGLAVAAPGQASETQLALDIQLFGETEAIAGHIGVTLFQTIHAGKDRIWRKGAYPVWRRSKYFTGYNTETLSLLPLLTDELTTEVATALLRLAPAR